MKKAYRHGEICFLKVDKIPDNLEEATQKEMLKGSHGNPHTFDKGKLFLTEESENVFGYFIGKDTTLFHETHGKGKGKLKKAKLPDGNYQLRRQVEIINKEMQPVID